MLHAKMAPKGPVAMPKVRGNENIPEPTIDPTTIAVRANKESFCIGCDVMPVPTVPMTKILVRRP
jgi:hypothetical protein